MFRMTWTADLHGPRGVDRVPKGRAGRACAPSAPELAPPVSSAIRSLRCPRKDQDSFQNDTCLDTRSCARQFFQTLSNCVSPRRYIPTALSRRIAALPFVFAAVQDTNKESSCSSTLKSRYCHAPCTTSRREYK